MSFNKKIVAIILILITIRIFLPEIIKHFVNNYLDDKIPGYSGYIEDFDLSIYRGAYQIEGFSFKKVEGKKKDPFIYFKHADVSLSWKALFKGKILLDLDIDEPKMVFVDSSDIKNRQLGLEKDKKKKVSDWQEIYTKLVPFNLESLKMSNGSIHFKNEETRVPVDVFLGNLSLNAKNIHNSIKDNKSLFSTYEMTADVQGHSKLKSTGRFNILSKPISFDMSGELKGLQLTRLNPFFLAYGPVDVTSGKFELYLELASKDKKIIGYIKPFLEKVDVISGKENISSLKRFGFEFGGAISNLFFRNSKNKEVAAKIPIEGTLDSPDIGIWEGVKSAFDHSFNIEKVEKKVDNSIDLKKIKSK